MSLTPSTMLPLGTAGARIPPPRYRRPAPFHSTTSRVPQPFWWSFCAITVPS